MCSFTHKNTYDVLRILCFFQGRPFQRLSPMPPSPDPKARDKQLAKLNTVDTCRYMLILSTHPLLTHHDRFMVLRQVASPKAVKDLRLTEIQAIEWTPTVSMTSLPFYVCCPHQNHSNISGICWMRPQLVDFNGFLLCFPRDLCRRSTGMSNTHQKPSESIP